jgi:hypothetical protein
MWRRRKRKPRHFEAVWLNASDRGWGVIYHMTGALVVVHGRLLIHLTKAEADAIVLKHHGPPQVTSPMRRVRRRWRSQRQLAPRIA